MARLDDTQLRALIDLQDAYEATLRLWRVSDQHAGRMNWKTIAGRDYLYHVHGHAGSGKSLGPRSPETEAKYEAFRTGKQETKTRLAATEPDLRRAAQVYAAVGLPVADSWAAKLFQHLDREGLMGRYVLVIGTNAMPAYQIEAQQRMQTRLYATRDTDNAERPFQAIGHGSRELELLAAPSVVATLTFEPFMPATNLVEQEWLLMGQPLRQVICSLDRTPCGIEVPDPRFFALHKAWLSKKPGRDPRKAPKDMNQAKRVWSWLPDMPGHPVDATFRSSLPGELWPVLHELETGGDPSN